MTTTHVRRFVGVARMGVGLGSWIAPRAAVRTFGIDPDRSSPVITRLFGARDLALGSAMLLAPHGRVAEAATLGAVIDAVDAVGTAIEHRRGEVSPWAAVSVGGGAALLSALGVMVARDARRAGRAAATPAQPAP